MMMYSYDAPSLRRPLQALFVTSRWLFNTLLYTHRAVILFVTHLHCLGFSVFYASIVFRCLRFDWRSYNYNILLGPLLQWHLTGEIAPLPPTAKINHQTSYICTTVMDGKAHQFSFADFKNNF